MQSQQPGQTEPIRYMRLRPMHPTGIRPADGEKRENAGADETDEQEVAILMDDLGAIAKTKAR